MGDGDQGLTVGTAAGVADGEDELPPVIVADASPEGPAVRSPAPEQLTVYVTRRV